MKKKDQTAEGRLQRPVNVMCVQRTDKNDVNAGILSGVFIQTHSNIYFFDLQGE